MNVTVSPTLTSFAESTQMTVSSSPTLPSIGHFAPPAITLALSVKPYGTPSAYPAATVAILFPAREDTASILDLNESTDWS